MYHGFMKKTTTLINWADLKGIDRRHATIFSKWLYFGSAKSQQTKGTPCSEGIKRGVKNVSNLYQKLENNANDTIDGQLLSYPLQ